MIALRRSLSVAHLEHVLRQSWQALLLVLSAGVRSSTVGVADEPLRGRSMAGGRQPANSSKHFSDALDLNLRAVSCLQSFLPGKQQLNLSQIDVLPRICKQILCSNDEDLRLQLLVCCFRFYHQQCPAKEEGLRLLHTHANAQSQALAGSTDDKAADTAVSSRAVRVLALLGAARAPHSASPERLLELGFSLLHDRQELAGNTMHNCLMQLWKGIRISRWQPECLRDLGLLAVLQRLQVLAGFSELATLPGVLQQLERQLVKLHLAQHHPEPGAIEVLLAGVLGAQQLLQGGLPDREQACPGIIDMTVNADWSGLQRCRAELAEQLANAAVAADGDGIEVNTALLSAAYALMVTLTLAGTAHWMDLYRTVYLLLAQHWYQQLPVTSAGVDAITRIVAQRFSAAGLEDGPAGSTWLRWVLESQRKLLQVWPQASVNPDQNVPLASSAGLLQGSIAIDAMPVMLASGLDALAEITETDFTDLAGFRLRQPGLQSALMLLEQGSAAVRVTAVEKLSRMLLDVYLALDWLPAEHFPGTLLWQAHCHLLVLLDTAAAWLVPVVDIQLLNDLSQCQQVCLPCGDCKLAEPETVDWRQLRQQLQTYVQALTSALDIQVRLHIRGQADSCKAEQLQRLQEGLIPLLRFQLLDFSLSLEQRRARHQPMAGNIWLELVPELDGYRAVLRDDSGRPVPDVLQWQQLLHRLKRAGLHNVNCSSDALGRRFECSSGLG